MKKYFYLLTALFLVTGSLLIAASPQDDVDNQFSVGSYSDGMTLDSSGNLIPNADNVNDLGTTTYSWQDLVLDGDITLGDDITIGGDATITGTADVANILTDTLNLTKTDLTVSTSTKISTLGSSFYRIQSSAPVTGSAGDAIYMNSSGTDSCIQTTGRTAGDIVILYSSATTRKPVRILNSTTTQKIALGLVSGRTYLEIEDNSALGLIFDGTYWVRLFYTGGQAYLK